MDKRIGILFSMLNQGEYQTAGMMAEKLHVSTKTVRNLLKEGNALLKKHGASIVSKYGAGYGIEISDTEAYEQFKRLQEAHVESSYMPETSQERVQYLLEYLFESGGWIKLDQLSESLYVSKRTLTCDLKEVERFLKKFNLHLTRKPNYGIRVEGKEFNQRLCLAAFVGQRLSGSSASIEIISAGVSDILQQFDFPVSNMAFQNLIIHIYIAIQRIRSGNQIPMPEEPHQTVRAYQEYQVAGRIGTFLQEEFSVAIPDSEIVYIAIHLAGKKLMIEDTLSQNMIITQEISDLVTDMLQLVYDAFRFDFRNDLELRMSLSQHIVPLSVRVRYDMVLKNPMLREVKEKFCLSYTMASQAATVINKKYQTIISEDEVGYMAFAFALALERKKTQIARKNVLLVCASGRGSAQLLLYKYKNTFGPYLNRIEVCDVGNLYKVDFSDIDYVFTTVPISIPVPVPIQEVELFLQDEDIINVKKALTAGVKNAVTSYYERDLFIPHLSCKTKEEVLKVMCEFLITHKNLPAEFYDSVLERESLAKTVFGNMVAMPHPYKSLGERTCCCVAILDEPVMWSGEPVQVIFLVSVGSERQTDTELQEFYQMSAAFMLGLKHVQELIKKRDYDWFIHTMTSLREDGA